MIDVEPRDPALWDMHHQPLWNRPELRSFISIETGHWYRYLVDDKLLGFIISALALLLLFIWNWTTLHWIAKKVSRERVYPLRFVQVYLYNTNSLYFDARHYTSILCFKCPIRICSIATPTHTPTHTPYPHYSTPHPPTHTQRTDL